MESKKKISSDMHAFMRELIKEVLEEESLRNWFDEEWVRIDTQGNITGPCGTMKNKKRPSRCLPKAKAQSLSKAERAATARKKKAGKGQFVPNTKKAKVTRETANAQDGKADLIQQFRKESGIKQCSIYDKRDNCGPAAIDFISWAKSKGIEGLKRINGYFKADIPASSKRDFTREMKQEFLNDGGNWDSDKERFDWISNSKYAEQWKHIPHYWVEDTNGKIYDPVGQQQFIDTGYAKDINPDRYTLTDIVENYADDNIKVTREDITNLVVGMIYEMSGKGQFVPNTKKARVTSEIVAILESDYEPTNKDLWSRAIAAAKRKFDKYPSAYANAWASKWYKGKGGNWKKKKK